MNNDQRIAEQLDCLGRDIVMLTESANALRELREDLSPRVNEAVRVLIGKLAEIEGDISLEDLLDLVKNLTRSIRNLNWSLDQLKNLIDFLRTVEPLLKSTVPQAIYHLDGLEQHGVFRMLAGMMSVIQGIAATYTIEDMEQIADGLVRFVGVAKRLSAPEPLEMLTRLADVPARVDLAQAKPVGPFGMIFALRNPEVKEGLGVLLQLTKGLALLKGGGNGAAQFVCVACQKDYTGKAEDVMTECRVCHRLHCKDCVDEFGQCVECRKTALERK